jgi:hypothetical protein
MKNFYTKIFVISLSGLSAPGINIVSREDKIIELTGIKVKDIPCRVNGNFIDLSVPLQRPGLAAGAKTIDFKWADNMPQSGGHPRFYGSWRHGAQFAIQAQV